MRKSERVLAIVGAIASTATAVDYFIFDSAIKRLFHLPDVLPTGLVLIVVGPLLLLLAGALFLAGRASTTNLVAVDRNNQLAQQKADIVTELDQERAARTTLNREVEDLRRRLDPLQDLPPRIRGILKTGAHSRRDLVESLSLSFQDGVHTQAVADAVGRMEDVTTNGLGYYVLSPRP